MKTVIFDDNELFDVLTEIESIMDNTEFDDVLWNGDLNWHMARNSGFSTVMKNFLTKLGLKSLWEQYPVDYTHMHTDDVSSAVLDHFIVNERLLQCVKRCQVLHRGDNMSRPGVDKVFHFIGRSFLNRMFRLKECHFRHLCN